jgi:hypothetical protein
MQKPFPTFNRIVPPVDVGTIMIRRIEAEPKFKFDGMDGFSSLDGVSLQLLG